MNTDYFINQPSNLIPESFTIKILKENSAFEYHSSLPFYQPTPLFSLPDLAKRLGVGDIYIKNEALRFGLNAFKGLGASYAIQQLLNQRKNIKTFCTATDGNHGRAVAWATRLAGKESVILVPEDTSLHRIEAIRGEGGKVIQTDAGYDETCMIAADLSNKNSWQLVQDTAWEGYEEIPALIMAGYLTLFREMEDSLHLPQKSKMDVVFLQAGVGSFAASAIWYYLNRYGQNRPEIVIVEPDQAAGIFASLKAGRRIKPEGNFQTIMAGLNCGLPSLNAWEIIRNGADVAIKVSDDYAERAMRELYYPIGADNRLISGESGAAGFAGFLALITDPDLSKAKEYLGITDKSRILFINTEGATDPDSFQTIITSKGNNLK